MITGTAPALRVDGLTISDSTGARVVDDATLGIVAGRIHAIVGESGSGKTTLALAMLGFTARGLTVDHGRVLLGERDLLALDESGRRSIRGRSITYVPQEATTALDPRRRVGQALERMRRQHRDRAPEVDELLDMVQLPTSTTFQRRYPHQLSGGQQQRLAIAAALAPGPRVVVFDEPTTGLDAVVQAELLARLRDLQAALGFAAVFITHDLHAAELISDQLAVMLGGRVVETGPSGRTFSDPKHPYTRALLDALPRSEPGARLSASPPLRPPSTGDNHRCPFLTRCPIAEDRCGTMPVHLEDVGFGRSAACLRSADVPGPIERIEAGDRPTRPAAAPILRARDLRASYGTRQARTAVLHGVDLTIATGERVALVGESGSGKSTLARCVAGLHTHWTGRVEMHGEAVALDVRKRPAEQLATAQTVFQNPASSLNPRRRVIDAVALSGRKLLGLDAADARARAAELLATVELDPSLHRRRPQQLSGGERQRVAIAQALIAEPRLLICDEVTSALDVSVQAGVIELLRRLSDERGLALLFITHDLGVVASIAHRVVVLRNGTVVENAPTEALFARPRHDYTRELIAAGKPVLDR